MKRSLAITVFSSALLAASFATGWGQEAPASGTAKLNITMEQRHVIKEGIKDLKIAAVPSNTDMAVGDDVPKSAQLHPIPSELSGRISQLKNHMFLLNRSQVILVDSKNKVV